MHRIFVFDGLCQIKGDQDCAHLLGIESFDRSVIPVDLVQHASSIVDCFVAGYFFARYFFVRYFFVRYFFVRFVLNQDIFSAVVVRLYQCAGIRNQI